VHAGPRHTESVECDPPALLRGRPDQERIVHMASAPERVISAIPCVQSRGEYGHHQIGIDGEAVAPCAGALPR
jgi:hypothetical protein